MPVDHINVVYPGLNIAKYASDEYPADPVIGFFYRMNSLDGLHILAEAFVKMKASGNIPRLRLRIGGGSSGNDRRFLKKIRAMLAPYSGFVDWCEGYSLSDHAEFYRHTTVVCVPVTFNEAVGLYVCEAFAAGRPVVEPTTGSFPEIVADGGVLYPENTPEMLAEALTAILSDKELFDRCRRNALRLAAERYSDAAMAKELERIYRGVV